MNMFNTRTMMGIVEEGRKDNPTFFRDTFFKNRRTFDTARIDFDIVGAGTKKIAPFVNPKVGGVAIDREGYRTESYEAPEVSPERITTAEDMLKLSAGETIYSAKSPNQRAAEQLGEDLRYLDEIITRREEVMCAEALFNGQVTVKGEGYDEVINYWNTEDKPVETALWLADDYTAADIRADIRAMRRKMIKKGGFNPTQLICGVDVAETLLGKLSEDKTLDMLHVNNGQIDVRHLSNGLTYYGFLKDAGIDIYGYDSYYVDIDGTEKPFVPANKALLVAPGAQTTMAYGLVTLFNEQDKSMRLFEGDRVPDSWVQRKNPAGRIVQIKSRPIPIINHIYGFRVITATKA